ncbi:MAG: hypothetical protein NC093_10505 [Alistipes sp.]|nr:hypothetical protein [Alistipes sp.]
MRDYPYVCGADIHSIANKEFVRFETAKSRDIVVALDKSNIPFSAKYNDTEIVLIYDGNYKNSVDEITAKIMSENYDELLREIREKKSDDYLLLLSEVADVLNTTVGTLKVRPLEIQELLCKAYADFWICDTPTIQRELDRYITVNGRTLQDIQEYEKSKTQEKAPKASEKNATDDYFRRNAHAHFTRESEVSNARTR